MTKPLPILRRGLPVSAAPRLHGETAAAARPVL